MNVHVNEPTPASGCGQGTIFPTQATVELSFPMPKTGSAVRAEQIRAGASSAEGAASTGPERIPSMREDRSASGNARIGRLGAEDPSISSGEVS